MLPFKMDDCQEKNMKQSVLELLPPSVYLRLKHWDYRRKHGTRFKELQEMRVTTTESGYSYKPFDVTKSIFVHIPKCAGVSINKTIYGNLAGGHTTLDEYLNVFEPDCIANYFKFTVVRNPWDRVVSAYFFLRSGGFGNANDIRFSEEFSRTNNFADFVRKSVSKTNIWQWHHFRPQYHYMLEKRGKVHLDFVAFLENIDSDFVYIVDRMGLDRALTKSNKGHHSSYMDYYDEESRNIVAEVYAEDIRMLGYNFDNSSLEDQLKARDKGKIYSLGGRR